MDDILVLKTTHDLNHCVCLSDVGKELIAKAFAL